MIRHSCAACGRSINRTDRFFEHSDGTLCQDCLARLVPGKASRASTTVCPAPPPAWAILPELAPHGRR
ncbi:MAG: hypothetical protein Q8O35_13860 [Humidesulfovibrio sp.]|uniref:hypothetical protein n=1 Tax=Humidesulfovibrio sp. TaxID=2910988 RepID=UPI002734D76C|nr:hypothetical protein [Humidesulfovibrio sp.]MDP2849254.1 hypothetical protein [Humidesulfovibrio sp.]